MRGALLRMALVMAVSVAVSAPVPAAGYFLTAAQKRDLLLRGQMSDEEGRLYDVWIVPGYEGPWDDARKGWSDAGDSLADYGRATFYDEIGQSCRDVWRVGRKETLEDFALRGTRQAWQDDMALARQRTERRVFGWWLAYPWGLFEAVGSSIVRLGVGIPAGLIISASAYSVVPVGHFALPLPKSLWHSTVDGVFSPAAAMTWNTFVAPPLALLGEQPAPERADGFWLKMVSEAPPGPAGFDEAVEATEAWRRELLEAVPCDSLDATVGRLEQEKETRISDLQRQIRAAQEDAERRAGEARDAWLKALFAVAQDRRAQLRADLRARGLSEEPTAAERQALKAALVGDRLRPEEAQRLLDLVLGRAGEGTDAPPAPSRGEKTDPVKRSLEILENP